jgi:hypothetical protein
MMLDHLAPLPTRLAKQGGNRMVVSGRNVATVTAVVAATNTAQLAPDDDTTTAKEHADDAAIELARIKRRVAYQKALERGLRERKAAYAAKRKERTRELKAAWDAANVERNRALKREWARRKSHDPEFRAKQAAKARERYHANPELHRQKAREHVARRREVLAVDAAAREAAAEKRRARMSTPSARAQQKAYRDAWRAANIEKVREYERKRSEVRRAAHKAAKAAAKAKTAAAHFVFSTPTPPTAS